VGDGMTSVSVNGNTTHQYSSIVI